MTVGARIGVATLLLVLLIVGAVAGFVYKRPLTIFVWSNRRQLAGAGLAKATVASSMGPQTYWVGGQGPTLVLLHGAGDQAGTWAGVAATLVQRYRLVVPDLAGHGDSTPADGPLSVGQVVAGLEAVMNQTKGGPAIIVGNSLGAWVAMLYAHAHPDQVSRLVLVNGGALRGERSDVSLMPKSREEAAALMTQLRDGASAPIPGYVLDDVVRTANAGPIARLSQTATGMEQYLLDGKLGEVSTPVDLLWGLSDKLFPLSYASRMTAGLPASRLTTLVSCGHVPHQECPQRFETSLSDILKSAAPSREATPTAADASTPGVERGK
ncbi:MAG: alpha/beta hydrolase [Acidobacteriota bacterium]